MWSTGEAEKKAHVDVVFTRDAEIDSVEIVNNGAAFIEILVSKGKKVVEDPQSLLPIVSLRSSNDAKLKQNTDARRLFGQDKMHLLNSTKKWRSMRVVLTQPFSDKIPIGLRSLKIRDKGKEVEISPIKKESPGVVEGIPSSASIVIPDMLDLTDSDSSGEAPLTALRTMTLVKRQSGTKKGVKKAPPPKEASNNQPSFPMDALVTPPKKKIPSSAKKMADIAPTFPDTIDLSLADGSILGTSPGISPTKVTTPPAPQTPPKKAAPKKAPAPKAKASSSAPLKGVCVVLSGFQNPTRGQLREAAISLGAKYANEWKDGGTHLVTAFPNTPKFNEVIAAGKGYIVSKEWLLDSKQKGVRQPERKYRVESPDSSSDESVSEGGSSSSSDFWASSDPSLDSPSDSSSSACRIDTNGDLQPVKKKKKLTKKKPKPPPKAKKVNPKPPTPSPKKKIVKKPSVDGNDSPKPVATSWKKPGSQVKKVSISISPSPPRSDSSFKAKNKAAPVEVDRELKNRKIDDDDEESNATIDVDQDEIDRGIEKLQRWAKQQHQQSQPVLQSSLPSGGSILGLPSFLKGVLIHISPTFSPDQVRKFKKRVCAGGGRVVSDPHAATHTIVDDANVSDITSAILVLPSWLDACESSSRIMPPVPPYVP
eukprot:TRINITY_DN754_c4_g1_i1.p1 TRINITY_DN754_c4_g1~~TRINITY_DN754_c4_g1_i1.p1  ORF type:complete len:696 (+),score=154.28 TRINITY_DN754_c4_g1_i1:138-2090(+)